MDRKTVLEQIRSTLSDHITVERICLFGSRARGTFNKDSDYDIAVISPDFTDISFHERQQLVRPLIRQVLGNTPLDVACYTPQEFEEGKDGFLPGIIEEEGITA